ncbi:MAG: DUF4290 domain-containing protein [Bacteroidetes bacterium]|nr:DUF4290 domain-containing protein [Bacteroidota bacterium]
MKYNTSEEQLRLRAYGRGVQHMVNAMMAEPDREKRTRMAHSIVRTMAQLTPDAPDIQNPDQRLWEHLQRLAGYQMEVDAPYPLPAAPPENASKDLSKKVHYYPHRARYRQFGKNVEMMLARAAMMEPGEARNAYLLAIANYMKHSIQLHANAQPSDTVVFNYLEELYGGPLPELDRENTRLVNGLLPNRLGASNASRPAYVRKSAKKTNKLIKKKKKKVR